MTVNAIGAPMNIGVIVAQSLANAAWHAGGGKSLNNAQVPGSGRLLFIGLPPSPSGGEA